MRPGSEDKYYSLIDPEQIGYLVVDFGEIFFRPVFAQKKFHNVGFCFFLFSLYGKESKTILPKSILMFAIVFIMFLE